MAVDAGSELELEMVAKAVGMERWKRLGSVSRVCPTPALAEATATAKATPIIDLQRRHTNENDADEKDARRETN